MKTAIITFIDKNFIQAAEVMFYSLLKHNKTNAELICCTTDDIQSTVLDKLGVKIRRVTQFTDFLYTVKPNQPKEVSYCHQRFHIFKMFEYDRIVHIDADTLIVGDISEVLNSKEPFSAVKDYGAIHYYPKEMQKEGLEDGDVFNGGLFVVNKPFLTLQHYSTFLDKLEKINPYNGTDQAYLSQYLKSINFKYKELPIIYNWCLDSYYPPTEDIRIIHFTGNNKPWNTQVSQYHKLWREYKNELNSVY